MNKQIKIELNQDTLSRLARMVRKDTDTADKHALEGILWEIAEKAGLVDRDGNPKE